jgi:hypothetical protein
LFRDRLQDASFNSFNVQENYRCDETITSVQWTRDGSVLRG